MDKIDHYNAAFELYKNGVCTNHIAKKLGYSRSTIVKWLNGKTDVNKLKGISGLNHSNIPDEEFVEAVKNSYGIAPCLYALGLKPAGGNYKIFHNRVKRLNLDTSHFTGQGHLKNKRHNFAREISVEDSFVENSILQTTGLKRKIFKYNLKPYLCDICGIKEWLNDPLSLHLDHINGVNNDNRLENLRFLCPNCHSQTDTYCGGSKGKNKDLKKDA
jgi:5-methylcytosine-specific restriction endonuclease McrA